MHNLFGERFFGERRAWHDLGPQIDRPMKAVEAWGTLSPFAVSLENLTSPIPELQINHRAIVRHPVPDDPSYQTLGIVGMEYVLIDPQKFCEIFDESVNVNVETMGALGKGELLFLSVQLPGMDIKGDAIENFMVVTSPYLGNTSYEVICTGVRPVCQNTLRAARRQSTESYNIVHDNRSESRLRSWMVGMYQRATTRTETLKQFLEIIADFKPALDVTNEMLTLIYPDPRDPRTRPNAPEEEIERRIPQYEQALIAVERTRSAVLELFQGKGTGLQTANIEGTGYALWNAVAEWESWRQTTKPVARAQALLVGDRADRIQHAYSTILDFSMKS